MFSVSSLILVLQVLAFAHGKSQVTRRVCVSMYNSNAMLYTAHDQLQPLHIVLVSQTVHTSVEVKYVSHQLHCSCVT